jgi:hypothetical protein
VDPLLPRYCDLKFLAEGLIQILGEMNILKKELEAAKRSWLQGLRSGHVGTIFHHEKTAYYVKNSPTRLHGFINQKSSICNFNTSKRWDLTLIVAVGRCVI